MGCRPRPLGSCKNKGMYPQQRQWFNKSLPQTLQSAVILFYINAAFSLLDFFVGGASLIVLLGLVLSVGAALGIANERKWGYVLGVVTAGLLVVLYLYLMLAFHSFGVVLDLLFAGVLLALLLHPQSRNHERIWFH